MQIQGAIIIIGSLFWENKNNCIQLKSSKELAEKRKVWRESKLNMASAKLIDLPITYGRKSTSRYCTYTMAFSNSIDKKGKGYAIPYKEKINIEENFNQLYCQALELAEVEGISKSGENTLVKKWGSVGLKLNSKFIKNNKEITDRLFTFWEKYFSKLDIDLYRIDENENHSITTQGLLNFDIEGPLDEIDYFLATPVSPNVKKYPDGAEIAKAMNESREDYFTYFVENYKNGITTKYDDEIIKNLPDRIKSIL
ncbi:hypothetical protein LDL77_15745 [Flagellimonas marinaquae]|uniref:hypothetical protein n=1 Tax=Flagellimonas aurea TaxID=2915619 RepID=UPI001CE04003|nr:hypothetical protein LDL77_15745 [Allomuricauda aquimarina]